MNDKDYIGPLKDLQDSMGDYVHNPTLIQNHILDYLSKVTKGEVEIVDATNPFVFLMESSSVTSAASISHIDNNLSKMYPVLATDIDDLYLHMSDEDFKERFAQPSTGEFTVAIQLDSIVREMVPSDDGPYTLVSIPKDTEVTVSGISFSFEYKVEIRVYVNNTIKVFYSPDNNVTKDVLETVVLSNTVQRDRSGAKWVIFDVKLDQKIKQKTTFNIINSTPFKEYVDFKDDFYRARVLYLRDGTWTDMLVSHSDQVFDPLKPTAVLTVLDNKLKVEIPFIYSSKGELGTEIQVITETTLGYLRRNFEDTNVEAFTTVIKDNDFPLTTADKGFGKTSFKLFNSSVVEGGRNALSFLELRERIITNNIGINDLPITPGNFSTKAEDAGFTSSEYIDSLTSRTYVLNNEPSFNEDVPFYTEIPSTFIKLTTSLNDLKDLATAKYNTTAVTLLPTTLYEITSSGTVIVPNDEVLSISSNTPNGIKDIVNSRSFVYSPFFYSVRYINGVLGVDCYILDRPTIDHVNFYDVNNSIPVIMNSELIEVSYSDTGYTLSVKLVADDSLKTLTTEDVFGQVSFVPVNGKDKVFIEAYQIAVSEDSSFIFKFKLNTNFDLSDDTLIIDDVLLPSGVVTFKSIDLKTVLTVTLGVNKVPVDYTISNMDSTIYKGNGNVYPISQEEVSVELGERLDNIWINSRVIPKVDVYDTYDEDVVLTYDKTNVAIDDVTKLPFSTDNNCNVIFNSTYVKGDPVIIDGKPVILHKKGSVKLDSNGKPIVIRSNENDFSFELYGISGLFYFVTEKSILDYLLDIVKYISTVIKTDMLSIKDNVLENTDVVYKPVDSLGLTKVKSKSAEPIWINKPQRYIVTLYVEETIFSSIEAKSSISTTVIKTINSVLKLRTVSIADIVSAVSTALGEGVISVHINYDDTDTHEPIVTLDTVGDRLSLAKELIVNNENELSIKESIEFVFIDYTVK